MIAKLIVHAFGLGAMTLVIGLCLNIGVFKRVGGYLILAGSIMCVAGTAYLFTTRGSNGE